MKKILIYIKFIGLVSLIAFLFAFTSNRNQKRKISEIEVEFIEEQNPYVSEQTVNKLLIQNKNKVTTVGKEILVLNTAEKELDKHKMIENSDVYLTVNGRFMARVKQRTPIARVNASKPFYVDATGNVMPLSIGYSAHVPIIYNVSGREIEEVYPLLKKIYEDEFLKKHVINVNRNTDGDYELGLRVCTFKVVFGKIEILDTKVRNFKAFYQKAIKDQTMGKYKEVGLQYSNQVVCTLK